MGEARRGSGSERSCYLRHELVSTKVCLLRVFLPPPLPAAEEEGEVVKDAWQRGTTEPQGKKLMPYGRAYAGA